MIIERCDAYDCIFNINDCYQLSFVLNEMVMANNRKI